MIQIKNIIYLLFFVFSIGQIVSAAWLLNDPSGLYQEIVLDIEGDSKSFYLSSDSLIYHVEGPARIKCYSRGFSFRDIADEISYEYNLSIGNLLYKLEIKDSINCSVADPMDKNYYSHLSTNIFNIPKGSHKVVIYSNNDCLFRLFTTKFSKKINSPSFVISSLDQSTESILIVKGSPSSYYKLEPNTSQIFNLEEGRHKVITRLGFNADVISNVSAHYRVLLKKDGEQESVYNFETSSSGSVSIVGEEGIQTGKWRTIDLNGDHSFEIKNINLGNDLYIRMIK